MRQLTEEHVGPVRRCLCKACNKSGACCQHVLNHSNAMLSQLLLFKEAPA
jgi:hypothetical protein